MSEILTTDADHKGRILLVDDEPLVRRTLQKYLEKGGYAVDVAENGLAALRRLEQKEFDLVITDLKMPELDGRELLKYMAEKFSQIPRIVLTAIGSNDDILLALKTGAYDFISKPIIDFALLGYTIDRALERKWLDDERKRAIRQIEKVNEIISMLNRGMETEEVFKMLDVSLKTVIPFNRISLLKIDEEKSSMIVKLAASDAVMVIPQGHVIPFEKVSLHRFMKSVDDVFIVDNLEEMVNKYNFPSDFQLLKEEGIRSLIFMTLTVNDRCWGYIFFASGSESAYNKQHEIFLRLITGQIALGIQRGELLAELEMHTKHLEHMVKIRTYEVLKTQKTTIFALSRLAETRDNETGDHINRMRNYCIMLAQFLKYCGKSGVVDNQFLRDIYDTSILHDIGKVGISDQILLKAGPLTRDEFEVMKTHTTIGYLALKDPASELGENSFLDMAKDIILYHHERWDGIGYPKGLKGEEIPLSARIVSVCDVYDALTSRRPYKRAYDHETALNIMLEESYRFDPFLLNLFKEHHSDFDRVRCQFY
jgi:response regulator RpfG family c-di-GMP phosphodiesterase